MRKQNAKLTWLILILVGVIWQVAAVNRQSVIIERDEVVFDFPNEINFSVQAASDVPITRVELEYGLDVNACATDTTRVVPDNIEFGTTVSANWTWNMRRSGSLPPGARLWYRWRITDEAGDTFISEQTWLTWLDSEHDWRTVSSDNLFIHWYEGDEAFANALLGAGIESQARIEQDIGAEQTKDVNLYIYGSTDDLRDAILFEPGWTGGLAYSNSNIVLIGVSTSNLDWGLATVAHELAHVIIGNSLDSCYASVPTWLNEGLAVYAEGPLDPGSAAILQNAIDDNSVYSVPALSEGFSEHPGRAQVSYAQSYSLTAYLIETYGQEKMRTLLRQFDEGYRYRAAIENTYGITIAEFERDWRAWVGAAPQPAPTEVAVVATVYPTFAPYSGQTVSATVTPLPTPQGGLPASASNDTPPFWQTIMLNLPWLGLICLCLMTASIVIVIPIVLVLRRKANPNSAAPTVINHEGDHNA